MPNTEISPETKEINEAVEAADKKVEDSFTKLLDGPRSDMFNLRQIQLAAEYFVKSFPGRLITSKDRNEIMNKWGADGYSGKLRRFIEQAAFKEDPRFGGHFANITLEDLLS